MEWSIYLIIFKSRCYTGSKTKLLEKIDEVLLRHFSYENSKNLSFFDVFAGTGVVSEYFIKKQAFKKLIINDFLESNFVIYQGFFAKDTFDKNKLEFYAKSFNEIKPEKLAQNYYSKNFGSAFFSTNDAKIIGYIRNFLDEILKNKNINKKEFYILLASLLYSADKIANTVGHYDAYRKNIKLQDKFIYELIEPLDLEDKNMQIYKKDSNLLAKELLSKNSKIDVAFLDPPYNSRQHSRFYHLLETLSLNTKPKLYGIAKKPEPNLMSKYCQNSAKEVLKDLLDSLKHYTKFIVLTYNNTYNSKSNSSQNKISLNELECLLKSYGKTHFYECDFKAFNSGKTDFKDHKEYIFICEIEY